MHATAASSKVSRTPPARRSGRGRHRAEKSRAALKRAITRPLLVLLSLALTTGVGNVLVRAGVLPVPGPPAQDTGQTVGKSRAEALIERHGCWTGAAPRGQEGALPASAVVIPPGGEKPVHGTEWAGPALEHVFEGKHPRLTVLAFCSGRAR